MKKPLVVIAGATATGKSALAVNIAKIIGGEIISADSMQVYKYMDVGTAKVTEEEMCGIKHYLLDCLVANIGNSLRQFFFLFINNIGNHSYVSLFIVFTTFFY